MLRPEQAQKRRSTDVDPLAHWLHTRKHCATAVELDNYAAARCHAQDFDLLQLPNLSVDVARPARSTTHLKDVHRRCSRGRGRRSDAAATPHTNKLEDEPGPAHRRRARTRPLTREHDFWSLGDTGSGKTTQLPAYLLEDDESRTDNDTFAPVAITRRDELLHDECQWREERSVTRWEVMK